jgi:hypothetical protein
MSNEKKASGLNVSLFAVHDGKKKYSPMFYIGESVWVSGKMFKITKIIFDMPSLSFKYGLRNHGSEFVEERRIDKIPVTKSNLTLDELYA